MNGNTIKAEIVNAGVTNKAIANKLGVTQSTFSRWLRGEVPEGKAYLIRLVLKDLTDK